MRYPDLERLINSIRSGWKWAGWSIPLIGLVVWVHLSINQVSPPVNVALSPTSTGTPLPTATANRARWPAKSAEIWQHEPGVTLSVSATPSPIPVMAAAKPANSEAASPRKPFIPLATATPRPTSLFVPHRVAKDETLISIASAYGISSETILVANDLRDPARLVVNQVLLIPPRDGFRLPVLPHVIVPGETLLRIALVYGSSVKNIRAANPHIDPDSLRVDDILAVPLIFNKTGSLSTQPNSDEVYYPVVAGDTPLRIARRFRIPVELLLTANEITDPTRLKIGQRLLIPSADGLTQGMPIILYDLREGDTLLEVASRFGSSVKDILATNPRLDPSTLKPGQTVAVPVIFAPPRPVPAPYGPRETPTPAVPPPGLIELEQQMAAGVNAERAKAGLPPYEVDQEVAALALDHAQDMIVRDYFAHVAPDGMTVRNRFTQWGIKAINIGEDIQRNTRPAHETVQVALDWFMHSPPHRTNILHPRHNRIGIGIVESPPGWYTLVLVFAQR